MARQSLRAVLAALLMAVLVGFRNATGTAPPPPLLGVESVEWLSPEPEDPGNVLVVFEDPDPLEISAPEVSPPPQRRGLARLARAVLDRVAALRG